MLNYEAFDDVLKDPNSGLTHTALTGKQKQSYCHTMWCVHWKGTVMPEWLNMWNYLLSGMKQQMGVAYLSSPDASTITRC